MTPPIAVFTDRDPNLMTVLAAFMEPGAVWDGATHFYCIWHLSKNVHEHLRRLFLGDKNNKAWKKVHDFFWEIVKDTDISAKASFAARWNNLVELVQTTATCRDESQLQEHRLPPATGRTFKSGAGRHSVLRYRVGFLVVVVATISRCVCNIHTRAG